MTCFGERIRVLSFTSLAVGNDHITHSQRITGHGERRVFGHFVLHKPQIEVQHSGDSRSVVERQIQVHGHAYLCARMPSRLRDCSIFTQQLQVYGHVYVHTHAIKASQLFKF